MIRRLAIPVAIFVVSIVALVLAIDAEARVHRHHHHRHHRARIAKRVDPVKVAVGLAIRYWDATPCSGNVRIVVAPPPANDENGGVGASMYASWNVGTPTENDETAPLPFSSCTLGINPVVWTSAYFEGYTAWPEFAVGIIHEWGHLLGQAHSTDTASVMYPEPSANVALTGETAPGWR